MLNIGPSEGLNASMRHVASITIDSASIIFHIADRMPGLNFAGHCKTPIDQNHRTLFSCPVIERGIRTCQQNGKKVLIAIGGPRGKGSFEGESQAEKFAENIWNLFLGGDQSPDLRPFSR